MVAVRVCMRGVEGLRSELTTERRHVVGIDFEVVYKDAGVVDCSGKRIRGAHVAVDNEFEVVGARGQGDDGGPG